MRPADRQFPARARRRHLDLPRPEHPPVLPRQTGIRHRERRRRVERAAIAQIPRDRRRFARPRERLCQWPAARDGMPVQTGLGEGSPSWPHPLATRPESA